MHVLILILLILPLYLINIVFTGWELLCESNITWLLVYVRSTLNNNFILTNTDIITNLFSNNINNINPFNSFFSFNTNLNTQFFELDLDTNMLRQVIYNHTFLYIFKVSIFDISSSIIDIILIPLVLILTRYYLNSPQITL